jgi:hypothetical protein
VGYGTRNPTERRDVSAGEEERTILEGLRADTDGRKKVNDQR